MDVLGFDCGGQQWVLEVCLPLGHLQENNHTDIDFVTELLATIEEAKVPAASPIEQRCVSWLLDCTNYNHGQ